jgi:hypothetical protein
MRIFNFNSFNLSINEDLSPFFYDFLKKWLGGASGPNREYIHIPESIFIYLKKLGYLRSGTIYRVINIDPFVVTIKQESEYYDLYRFLIDDWDRNMDLLGFNDSIIFKAQMKKEREVVSRLTHNFSIIDIKNYVTRDRDPDKKDININALKNIIISKNKGNYLSFTSNIFCAEWFSEYQFLQLHYDNYDDVQKKLPESDRDSYSKRTDIEQRFYDERAKNNMKIAKILGSD